MKKKTLIYSVAALLLIGSAATAYALLPALAFAEVGTSILSSFVIRSAGRQVVATVATAANDATWASGWLSWFNASRGVAVLAVAGLAADNRQVTYEVPVTAVGMNDRTHADENTFLYEVFVRTYGPPLTIDGVTHTVPLFRDFNPDNVVANIIADLNPYLKPEYKLGAILSCAHFQQTYYSCMVSKPGVYPNNEFEIVVSGSLTEDLDNIVRLNRAANGQWTVDQTDPDAKPADIAALANGAALRIKAQDANSDLLVYPEANNLHVQYRTKLDDDRVTVRDSVLDPQGIPQSVTEQTAAGNLTDVATAPGTGTGTGTTVNFPSDYARQGEVQTALDHLLFTGNPPPSDPVVPQTGWTDFGTTFNSLTAWTLPAHTATCPTSSFSAFGQSFTLDSHCQLINDHFVLLSNAMAVVWTISALFVVLRA